MRQEEYQGRQEAAEPPHLHQFCWRDLQPNLSVLYCTLEPKHEFKDIREVHLTFAA